MAAPCCDRLPNLRFHAEGYLAEYLHNISQYWLKVAPFSNPGLLEMFRDRDRLPYRNLVPWAGEFAGKYLTGAVQVLRLTGDPGLHGLLQEFVGQLLALQAEDGYLGPWPKPWRLANQAPNAAGEGQTWDTWGHYHLMLGLLFWYEQTHEQQALTCVQRMADLLCRKFLGDKQPRLVETGSTEMNLAPAHALCLLYKHARVGPYLDLALQLVEEFGATDAAGKPLAGDYLQQALAGKEFFAMPRPRWESLHPILTLAELYYLTGQERYRQAFEAIWWSIVKLDRHNNGGFSSDEQAQGNPYHPGVIETCCTIAWMALSVEMLRLTGNPLVADELELATLNAVLGLHSVTGRWATYNTPMDGVRQASTHALAFQAREGTPELNCCSVNSARGLGMLSDWALMQDAEGLRLHWYGAGTMLAGLPSGLSVRLTQETDYPCEPRILLQVDPSEPTAFALKLRIPQWSEQTAVRVNETPVENVPSGAYLTLDRTWKAGDRIEILLDFALHYWVGARECAGKVSVYRGPVLLTYDRRFNAMDPDALPVLDARGLSGSRIAWSGWLPPLLLLEFPTGDGSRLRLCDFGSAGEGGSPYRSWLLVDNILPSAFSRQKPLPSGREVSRGERSD
ncbi:MAG TPA: beta-L-arabinofuranosidase domain-containing protein [Chthonomonadaceae bacterium]|nr:beta-L-arabinofuranosidase domain-containing protein [Chthonomonadaceae bacterium]HZT42194.1 beta-L-arabinofuranosidase domain-containing protein [Chthonomonadaceae bacterium]